MSFLNTNIFGVCYKIHLICLNRGLGTVDGIWGFILYGLNSGLFYMWVCLNIHFNSDVGNNNSISITFLLYLYNYLYFFMHTLRRTISFSSGLVWAVVACYGLCGLLWVVLACSDCVGLSWAVLA